MNEESLISKEGLIPKNQDYLENQDEKYLYFIKSNKIYPQSKIYSLFSFMTRHYTYGKCISCKKLLGGNNSYDNGLNYLIYLPKYKKNKQHYFSQLLKANIETAKNIEMYCPKCRIKNNFKETTKFIKFPEIFIFHLNRFAENNNIINKTEIIPDDLEMSSYRDYNLKISGKIDYKLFAVYIMKNCTNGTTEHICQIVKDGKWYEFNNGTKKQIQKPSYYGNSCGLYYMRC